MVFVYVLQSQKDYKYYIGICKDLTKRLEKHNKGKVRSTKIRRPLKVVYAEEYSSYSAARKREKEIKSFKGGNKFSTLIS
ncbi:GIY-YIG nuclease family protein [Candidatus Daviesbacteria bacterium]|nr:GIY-YIG nuclease family protein [Candidatus Daviesbacteria bacterium]